MRSSLGGGNMGYTMTPPQSRSTVYSAQGTSTPVASPLGSHVVHSSPQRLDNTFMRPQSTPGSHGPGPQLHGMQHSPSQMPSSPNTSPTVDSDMINHAAKHMDRVMNKDLQYPSLYKSLSQAADSSVAGSRPVSGFMDFDYPPFAQRSIIPENLYMLTYSNPIPSELNELLNQTDSQCFNMGLFPEIYRAWLTLDSDIYLWDFRDGSDLSFYDGLKEPVVGVALVPAKEKIFQNSIKHLLCVTTANQIVILGFVLTESALPSKSDAPVIELFPQPIFVLPTESVQFPIIHGTKNGRIFLGGRDGSVHEVSYQAQRGWLSDRCWKTNLTKSFFSTFFQFVSTSYKADSIQQIVSDDVRNLLYIRSESGLIQVFDLGDGTEFSKIGHISFDGIINDVITLSKKTLEGNIVKKLLTISPITTGELNLVGVLDNGTRLYFTCYNLASANMRPSIFQLVHVRMPPGYCTAYPVPKPTVAHNAFVASGLYALCCRSVQDYDSFWLISPFMYPTSSYSEVFSVQSIPGATMDIKLLSDSCDSGLENLPDVIIQHLKFQKQIVVLSSSGTFVYTAHRPFEILKQLIIERGTAENLRQHFECGVSKEQPLANSAFIAVHPTTRAEPSVFDVATKAFFLYSGNEIESTQGNWGEPRVSSPFENTLDFNPNLVSTPRQDGASGGHNYPYSPNQSQTQFMQSPGGAGDGVVYSTLAGTDQHNFSQRHDAVFLVVGRVLYHFWNRPLVKTGRLGGPGTAQITIPNVEGHEVAHAINFLQNILYFINKNPSLYMTRSNINTSMIALNTPEGRQLYNQEVEKSSMLALRSFIKITLEVLNMWKILCDHQFHIVLHGIDSQLHNSSIRDLVLTGHATVSVIINALISKYLGDNTAVDAISLRLREVCPTLFKSEDAIGSKVAEILSKVKNLSNPKEKENLLRESLVLSEKICGHSRVNVRSLCKQYSDLGFPVGAVRLCISAAKAADPEKVAYTSIKSASGDSMGMQAFQARAEVYRIVFDLLENYMHVASSSQSPISRSAEERIAPHLAQRRCEETINAILESDDEIFHVSLYNWLLERKQFDRLLEIKHPYLDAFLQRSADAVVSGKWPGSGVSSNDTRVLDLLWRHHEMNNNHTAATHILSKLAESTTTGLSLQQRLEYLARAVVCSKSCSRRGDLLESLEDKLEVAQIQKNILDSITAKLSSQHSVDDEAAAERKLLQEAVPKLNAQLWPITQLYTDFAQPLKLNDAKLEIFYAAGHAERSTIELIWSEIIEEELTANATKTMESQMELIRQKLVSLGRKYCNSPVFFPLEFLIEHLESMKPQDSENVSWVFKTMLEIGIPFSNILYIYQGLWRKFINRRGAVNSDVHIARVLVCMIESLANREFDIRMISRDRPDMMEQCKDLVSSMIVEFSSRFDETSAGMTAILNRAKDKLDRM